MLYTPSHIANYFLSQENHKITNLKLNNLICISFGFHACTSDRYLFNEDIYAWKYAHIILSIYHEFKEYGFRRIDRLSYIQPEDNKEYPSVSEKDEDIHKIISKVWETYGSITDWDMTDITHRDGTLWSNHYKKDSSYIIIPKEEIKKYYRDLLNDVINNP